MTHVFVVEIRDVANIGGITAVIVEVTPVTGLTGSTLPLAVGLDLITQTGPLIWPILAEKNSTRITWSINAGKIGTLQVHVGVGMRIRRTKMNINAVA